MSDQKQPKKVIGRGRGKPVRSNGPWSRSTRFDEPHDVRLPKKDGEEFVLTESSFPPLPGVAATGTLSGNQFDDEEAAGTSQINGAVNIGQVEDKSKVADDIPEEIRHEDLTRDKEESQQNSTDAKDGIEPPVNNLQPISIDVTNSNLSPYADEFIPRKNMNPDALDFVPSPTRSNDNEETNNNKTVHSSASNINVHDTTALLADLEETVSFCHTKLSETPGSYDELIGVVTPHFIKYMENPELPSEIVQSLYNYAITDSRFSYFSVKILMHLIKSMSTDGNTTLRNQLLKHTQEEVQITQTSRLTDPDVSCTNVIQPFLTFLSELYIQLEVGGRRLQNIGSALVDTLRKLLFTNHIPLKERLKLIVNMMKLTGLSLDQDDTSLLDGLANDLSATLQLECSNLDSPTILFVNDIILLRSLRWGLVEPGFENSDQGLVEPEFENGDLVENGDLANSTNGNHPYCQSNGYDPTFDTNPAYGSGVFYGPDGHPIAYEEQLFLEVESSALNQLQLGDQGETSPTSVEGYDEAYEEFLKTVPGHNPE